MEDHADRQRGLDRDVRVSTLAAGFAAGRASRHLEPKPGAMHQLSDVLSGLASSGPRDPRSSIGTPGLSGDISGLPSGPETKVRA